MTPNIVLFDPPIERDQLLPFTFTRPVSEIRCGILTITEKWKKRLGGNASVKTWSSVIKSIMASTS